MIDRFVYLLFRAVSAVLAALPLAVVFRIGRWLGLLAGWILVPYRRLALSNLTIAFGAEKTPRELRRLTREHFALLGANMLSTARVAQMTPAELEPHIRQENFEILETAAAQGKGVVWIISHLGNWELFAQLAQYFPERGLATVYQRLGNVHLEAYVRRNRERYGVQALERKEGFTGALKLLRKNAFVGVLVDQHAGDAGVWTPFFGRLASTSTLAATLALRTGAALVPVAIFTEPGIARWRYSVSPPVSVETNDPIELTAHINTALEAQIRQSPADWFWVHNRWKTPKPRFLLREAKRGIYFPPTRPAAKGQPFRIVIRSSNWLGDAVMSAPAVTAISRGRPDLFVTVLCKARLADFWKAVPGVAEVLVIAPGESVFRVAAKLRRGRFDAALLLPNSTRSGLEAWLAGIPRRVGFPAPWRDRLLNQIYRPKRKKSAPLAPPHDADRFLQLAEWLGADPADATLPAPAAPPSGKPLIALCPGAEYGPAKRWPPERFLAAAQQVAAARSCRFVIVGTAADQPIARTIATALGDRCDDLTGKTTLAELMAMLRTCAALLTNDTGTMHLASWLGVPVVAVFGSTEPALTGPRGLANTVLRHHVPCSPCFLRECPLDFRCMLGVEPAAAATAVLARLANHPPTA